MATDYNGNDGSNKFFGSDDREDYLVYGYGGNDTLFGNGGNDTIYGGDGKDSIGGEAGDDILEGGKGNDTISGGEGLDIFVYGNGDGKDVITDYEEEDKIQFKSGTPKFKKSGKDVVITVGDGKITVKGAADKVITYIDKDGNELTYPNTIKIDDKKVTLLEAYAKTDFDLTSYDDDIKTIDASAVDHDLTITGNKKSNNIIGSDEDDYIDGGKGADTILGGKGKDTLLGGAGDDVLTGGKGNDSLVGGAGSDIFVYGNGDGKDVITDYEEEDKIQFKSGTPKFKKSGKDVVITVGDGKITVKGAADKVITYIDKDGNELTYPNTIKIDDKKVTLLEAYAKTDFDLADYDDGIKTIDASAVDHDLTITGNKKANSIIGTEQNDYIDGGKGADKILSGDGNDILKGGKGNDTLTGGNGADIFLYASGDENDVITDYAEEDIISITSGVAKVSTKGDDVIFKVGEGKITVKGAKDNVITYFDANGEHTYPEAVLKVTKSNTVVTLLENYVAEQFDVNANAQVSDYATKLKTIDASAVDHDIELTGNAKNNRIIGGKEDSTLVGGKGADTLVGGSGKNVFVYGSGDGKDVITNYKEGDKISIVSGAITEDDIYKDGKDVVFKFNKSNTITLKNAKDERITYIDADGVEHEINNDTVVLNAKKTSATLLATYADDEFKTADYASTIKKVNASAVEHALTITANKEKNNIIGTSQDDFIDGGSGADVIDGGDGNDTIKGGKGNDTLTGGSGADVFLYASGAGNDIITDFTDDDIISITGAVATFKDKGKNVIMTVGEGKITIEGATDKSIKFFDADGVEKYVHGKPYEVSGKTVTLNDIYGKDSFDIADVSDKVTKIDASAVEHDLEITGNKSANRITGTSQNDYIDGGKGADTILGGDGDDTIVGGKGNDSLKGGDGADIFLYNTGDGNDVIVDYADEDVIKFTSGKVSKVKASSNNVVFTIKDGSTSGKITVTGGKDHVITYIDDAGEHTYPEEVLTVNKKGTSVTLKENYSSKLFDVTSNAQVTDYVGTLKTINASAIEQDIEIVGNSNANIIIGGDGDDTINGGKGADTLTGGKGQDVFYYTNGGGKDVIADYTEGEDVIQIATGTVDDISNSGKDVIFKVGKGTITVKNGKNKTINYIVGSGDDAVERSYPTPYTVKGETVTLTKKYYAETFDISDYDELSDVYNIDASKVTGNLNIKGDSKANKIFGAAGDNTIYGGKGNDTLYGGDGANLYVYNNGDGKDLIVGWGDSDIVSIASGNVSGDIRVIDDKVVFSVGSKGKISLQGAAGETVTWYDNDGKHSQMFGAGYSNVAGDDDYIATPSNDLSSIVQSKVIDYSAMQASDSLSLAPKINSVPVLSKSTKK